MHLKLKTAFIFFTYTYAFEYCDSFNKLILQLIKLNSLAQPPNRFAKTATDLRLTKIPATTLFMSNLVDKYI